MDSERRLACDDQSSSLLPWLANGRLEPADAAQVKAHLGTCAACRLELAELQSLQAALLTDGRIEYSPQPSLDKLLTRIDEMEREGTPAGDASGSRVGNAHDNPVPVPRWLVAALVVQSVGIGLLGSLLWSRSVSGGQDAPYHTLSAETAPWTTAPRLRVVFAPRTTVADLADVLHRIGAQVVTGPSETGTYGLALEDRSDGAVAHGLALLRSDPRVVFAEPIIAPAQSTQ